MKQIDVPAAAHLTGFSNCAALDLGRQGASNPSTLDESKLAVGIVRHELAGADPAPRFSPHCWKMRMALAHKNLEAERVPGHFSEKQVIALSGQVSVPMLIDDGETDCDSWAIALHLEVRYPKGEYQNPWGLAVMVVFG